MDEGMMILLYILAFIVVVAVSIRVAREFATIAEMKGHDETKYFWFTFLLGIVGMLMVIALPDKGKSDQKTALSDYDTNKINNSSDETNFKASDIKKTEHKWLCDSCGKMRTHSPCEFCGKE